MTSLETMSREELLAEVQRLQKAQTASTTSVTSKRAKALLKDYDLFTDLRATKTLVTSASNKLASRKWRRDPLLPEVCDIVSRMKSFAASVEATESRLIEECQDA